MLANSIGPSITVMDGEIAQQFQQRLPTILVPCKMLGCSAERHQQAALPYLFTTRYVTLAIFSHIKVTVAICVLQST